MPQKTPKHEPLIRGSFSTTTTAAAAGVAPSTVRSWDARGFVNARRMWPKIYVDERQRLARLREVAQKLKADAKATGEDVNWVDQTIAEMEQPRGPREFVDVELLQVCALAELTRHGFSPARTQGDEAEARDTYLLDALTRMLAELAYLVPAIGDREPLGVHEHGTERTRYLAAELRNETAGSLSLQDLTPSELPAYFTDGDRKASTVWTVIDCDALLQRILKKLDELKRREEPKR
jgi:hypothetical protein